MDMGNIIGEARLRQIGPNDDTERQLLDDVGMARLVAVGVGGGGSNAINRMIEAGVQGVDFIAMNTDAQALRLSRAPRRLRIGERLTRGLGAGGNPEIGRKAAEESLESIKESLAGADMVFVTAGMGGGTGTGASPLVARAARELGAIAVAIVTTPFAFERQRKVTADRGVQALREVVDAVIIVPNERLMKLAGHDMSVFEAYRLADDVLRQGIQGISDLITVPGLINLDFADVRAVMSNAGTALMSVGQASGENRAEEAARAAITNTLLDVDISGARGVVFNIAGGDDLTLSEVNRIADIVSGAAHQDANIIYGTVYDAAMTGNLKVTVVATGFEPRVRYDRERAAHMYPFVLQARQEQPAGQMTQPDSDAPGAPVPMPASLGTETPQYEPAYAQSSVIPAQPPVRTGPRNDVYLADEAPQAPGATVTAFPSQAGPAPYHTGAVVASANGQRTPRLGYFGDEFAATEPEEIEEEQDEHHRRHGLERFFIRH